MKRLLSPLFVLLFAAAAPSHGQLVFLCFGDSITAGAFDPRRPPGYPQRLENLLNVQAIAAEVESYGKGGETTGAGLSRIDGVLDQGGDVLLLMEGTNDISRRVSVETILFNLSEMASRAAQREILPVYATVIPRVPWANVDPRNSINGDFARGLQAQATAEGYRLVDAFAGFNALPDLFGTYYYPGQDDPVGHPNPLGYDVLAEIFLPVAIAAGEDVSGGQVHGSIAFESPGYLVGESQGSQPIGVIRSGGSFGAVSVEAVLDAFSTSVQFAHGEEGVKTVELIIEDDEVAQGDRVLSIGLSAPTGGAVLGDPATTSVTVVDDDIVSGPCVETQTSICLNSRRFQAKVHWRDFNGVVGAATVDELRSEDSGLFWYFEASNLEMLLKVLDGCEVNGHVWVFAAAATTVHYVLTVIDTELGLSRQYSSELGVASPALTDTQAFPQSCP